MPWRGMILLLVSSLVLTFLAGDFTAASLRDPAMPVLSVVSLSAAMTTILLSVLFLAAMHFAKYDDVVPPIMLCLVAMLCTACTLITLAEQIGVNKQAWLSHRHPTLLLVMALSCTAVAIHLAVRFDERSRHLATLFELRNRLAWAQVARPVARTQPPRVQSRYRPPGNPRDTLEM